MSLDLDVGKQGAIDCIKFCNRLSILFMTANIVANKLFSGITYSICKHVTFKSPTFAPFDVLLLVYSLCINNLDATFPRELFLLDFWKNNCCMVCIYGVISQVGITFVFITSLSFYDQSAILIHMKGRG